MPIISVGLFCYGKFEETPNEKVVNMSMLTKPYFSIENVKGPKKFRAHNDLSRGNLVEPITFVIYVNLSKIRK